MELRTARRVERVRLGEDTNKDCAGLELSDSERRVLLRLCRTILY